MIATVVGYLAKTLKDNKPIQDFFTEFTDAAVQWIKPVFLKEDEKTPKDVLAQLQEKPDSPARQDAAKSALAVELENNPQAEQALKELAAAIGQKEAGGFNIDNREAKIGQQNIGSTVNNTNTTFN